MRACVEVRSSLALRRVDGGEIQTENLASPRACRLSAEVPVDTHTVLGGTGGPEDRGDKPDIDMRAGARWTLQAWVRHFLTLFM